MSALADAGRTDRAGRVRLPRVGLGGASGRFRDGVVTSGKELEATARGTVVDAATVVEDERTARVLLFVDQEITTQGQDGSKLDQPRVTFDIGRQGGRWLVDEVQVNTLLTR